MGILDPKPPTRAELSATYGPTAAGMRAAFLPQPELPSAVTFSTTQPIAGGTQVTLTPSSPVSWRGGVPATDPNGIKTNLATGQLGMEFNVWGTAVAVKVYCQSADSTVRLHVEGKLVTVRKGTPIPGAAVLYTTWVYLTFPTDGPHRVKISGKEVYWQAIAYTATGGISPATQAVAPVRMVVPGDSWVGGALETPAMNTWASQLGSLLGIPEPMLAGQGGTGYVNTGPGADGWTQDFGDTRRLDPIIAAKPTDVVWFGSINDGTSTEAAIKAAAKAAFAYVTAALPTVRHHVIVPQPTTTTQQTSAVQVANRRAVTEAAQESTNVYTIINGVDDGWLNDGNRARFLGSDNTHLTQDGHDYIAGIIAEKLRPALSPGSTALATFTTYASDTYTRADGAIGTTESGAKAYSVDGGTVDVNSNALRFVTVGAPGSGCTALVDAGVSNCVIEANVKVFSGGAAGAVGLAFRHISGNSGFTLENNGGAWQVRKRTGVATFAVVATLTLAAADGQRLRVELSGSTITAKVDGTLVGTITDALNQTVTTHGAFAAYNNRGIDNLVIKSA
ncbi:hypothetical protein [Pseudarthrobacter sp. BRE9]|uniref:hypothetical protein n=1 Tax=Pseudarthrobacter sp. BRE9 TaxID=2962582 RepID=UPI00288137B2|nr:hypothetical protein [Pseudarthrobacter sp. BRE9]MDT0171005.1 hypothetical protein [Pseudarthrobacter sp. BRE9]